MQGVCDRIASSGNIFMYLLCANDCVKDTEKSIFPILEKGMIRQLAFIENSDTNLNTLQILFFNFYINLMNLIIKSFYRGGKRIHKLLIKLSMI